MALFIIFLALGYRPAQVAALKIKDLIFIRDDNEQVIGYKLMVPIAKQHGQSIRQKLKEWPLDQDIGDLLHAQCQNVRCKYAQDTSSTDALDELPLFPAKQERKVRSTTWEFHTTGQALRGEVKGISRVLNAVSERTGQQINFNPQRARHDYGTRLAENGHGAFVIAESLGHSHINSALHYVSCTEKVVERIDKAIALKMAPRAQAFMGRIILNREEAQRGNDPAARIRRRGPLTDPDEPDVGICGRHSFCGELTPIACYTCRSFQPWVDGPHEKVLHALLEERNRKQHTKAEILEITGLDPTIFAVAEVVRQCHEKLAGAYN